MERIRYIFALVFVLKLISGENHLDTFTDKKIKLGSRACTCTFAFVEIDELPDVKTARCDKKCGGKGNVKLGGPLPTSNLYQLEIRVTKGTVTVTKVRAILAAGMNPSTQTPDNTTISSINNQPENIRMGEFCERYVTECLDRDSFPNIGQAFRGYNLILGDPLNYDGDPGFESHIFDEFTERNGMVRFGNTAGNDLNRCDGSIRADYIDTLEQFMESTVKTKYSGTSFQIGTEIVLTAGFGIGVNGELNGGYGGIGGSTEGNIEATVTIPPLYSSISSNSKVMSNIARDLETNQISITRSSFSCHEYEFEITESQHPSFTGQFRASVEELERCFMQGPPFNISKQEPGVINGTSKIQDACAMTFIRSYGTHFIRKAQYGSKMSILTVLNSTYAYSANQLQIAECATKSKTWSFLGIIGGGSVKEKCYEDLFDSASESTEVVLEEIVVTVGSRPKADYSEWAGQQGKPEIIQKSIAPISDLFNSHFMNDMNIKFDEDGVALIKPVFDKYLMYYCGVFPSHCTFVTAMPFCPSEMCESSYSCGQYTGQVDANFLPHGKGTLSWILEGEVLEMIWVHGCTAGE